MKKSDTKGIIALFISGVLYSFYGVYSRLMGNNFSPFYQVWARGLINMILLVVILILTKSFIKPRKKDYKWFLFAGVAGGLADAFFYISVNHLPFGTALFVFYAFINFGGYFWGVKLFNEKLNYVKKISIILAVIGLILLYKNELDFLHSNPVFLTVAALAGLCVSIYLAFSKKISGNYSVFQIAASNNFFGFILLIPLSVLLRESMNITFLTFPWLINLIFAITQVILMPLVVYGFKHVEIQKGGLILLLQLVFGTLWGFFLFKEAPNPVSFIGIIFIGIALTLPLIVSRRKAVSKCDY
jgi:drug/metabolite transporter (DMT)-like permease